MQTRGPYDAAVVLESPHEHIDDPVVMNNAAFNDLAAEISTHDVHQLEPEPHAAHFIIDCGSLQKTCSYTTACSGTSAGVMLHIIEAFMPSWSLLLVWRYCVGVVLNGVSLDLRKDGPRAFCSVFVCTLKLVGSLAT